MIKLFFRVILAVSIPVMLGCSDDKEIGRNESAALKECNQLTNLNSNKQSKLLYLSANTESTLEVCYQALRAFPENKQLYVQIAKVHHLNKDYVQAINLLRYSMLIGGDIHSVSTHLSSISADITQYERNDINPDKTPVIYSFEDNASNPVSENNTKSSEYQNFMTNVVIPPLSNSEKVTHYLTDKSWKFSYSDYLLNFFLLDLKRDESEEEKEAYKQLKENKLLKSLVDKVYVLFTTDSNYKIANDEYVFEQGIWKISDDGKQILLKDDSSLRKTLITLRNVEDDSISADWNSLGSSENINLSPLSLSDSKKLQFLNNDQKSGFRTNILKQPWDL